MSDRVELRLIGITYNQVESGVYAVILQEEDGPRRLPIIIGYPEAQAIECRLQNVEPPRPLTHDLLLSSLAQFRITVREIMIHRLPNGIFAAEILLEGPRGGLRTVDARSSDAIALAIRSGAAIYTSRALMDEAGVLPETKDKAKGSRSSAPKAPKERSGYEALPDEQLQRALQEAVECEDYEKAGEIKKELDKRNRTDEEQKTKG